MCPSVDCFQVALPAGPNTYTIVNEILPLGQDIVVYFEIENSATCDLRLYKAVNGTDLEIVYPN